MARHKNHDEEHMSESWLIPYADILTLLLAVFIILFSTSESDSKKFQEVAEVFGQVFKGSAYILNLGTGDKVVSMETAGSTGGPSSSQTDAQNAAAAAAAAQEAMEADMRELAGQLQEYISEQGMSGELEVKMTGSGELVITIKERALFESGSADITAACRPIITNIANILKTHPDVKVSVSGHTDNVPIKSVQFASNWDLSSARATTAMRLLIQDSGLNPADFHSEGYGEYQPVATNSTEAGRSMNRRVEFSVRGNISEASLVIPMQ